MPIDLTQIETGEKFELLCEDLLRAIGFTIVEKVSRGADGGTDLIVSQTISDMTGFSEERRILVQCKHWAEGGKAVPYSKVPNYREAMDEAKIQRYLLITSTLATTDLQRKFKAVTGTGDYVTLIWSAADLTRLLDTHPDVRARHFPTEPELAPTQPRRLKIFLCHASANKPTVRHLYHRLRAQDAETLLKSTRSSCTHKVTTDG